MSSALSHSSIVLVLAYACHPSQGSEPGAGWTWSRAISRHSRVLLLTRVDGHDYSLERAIQLEGLPIELVRVPTSLDRWPGLPPPHLRYGLWLRNARHLVGELAKSREVDVIHHLTYASDWMPPAIPRIDGALKVWGPVGGATYPPRKLLVHLSIGLRIRESVRRGVTVGVRRLLVKGALNQIDRCLALNSDSARALTSLGARQVSVRPNVVLRQRSTHDHVSEREGLSSETVDRWRAGRRAIYVGRLIESKGLQLAIEALRDGGPSADWTLLVVGNGPARSRLVKWAEALAPGRVILVGHQSQSYVARALAMADAFVFPSLHEGSPWAVAEAVQCNLPVICFDLGGSAEVAGANALLIAMNDPVRSISTALSRVSTWRPPMDRAREWDESELSAFTARVHETKPGVGRL